VSALAEEAFAAGDGEGHDDPVANLELCVLSGRPRRLHHRLMADDIAPLHLGDDAIVDVKVEPQVAQAVNVLRGVVSVEVVELNYLGNGVMARFMR
jgi:hypothetical protein